MSSCLCCCAQNGEKTRKKMCSASEGYNEYKQKEHRLYLDKLKEEFLTRYENKYENRYKLEDFVQIRTLGMGGFGRVVLTRLVTSKSQFYAMKILDKTMIYKTKQIEHTLNEKKILQAIKFPFVVYMEFSFKDNNYVYFTMPFIAGGEMFTQLRKVGHFEEEQTKFYAAQVILALEYLHHCDMIYRDLKPENILIDITGYIKITDFGFCKIVNERTWTLCGTPEYLAPEIILTKAYGRAVDWWSFGVLVYEMNCGYPPFYSNDPMRIYEKIVGGKVKFDTKFNTDLRDLLRNTIQVDLSRRFGNLKNGVLDFKCHKWFKSINWDDILHGKVRPTYIPNCKSPGDSNHFEMYDEVPLRYTSVCIYEKEFEDF